MLKCSLLWAPEWKACCIKCLSFMGFICCCAWILCCLSTWLHGLWKHAIVLYGWTFHEYGVECLTVYMVPKSSHMCVRRTYLCVCVYSCSLSMVKLSDLDSVSWKLDNWLGFQRTWNFVHVLIHSITTLEALLMKRMAVSYQPFNLEVSL